MDRYLITGGAGFIGSNLVNAIVNKGNEVYIVDNLSTGKITNLANADKKKIHFYQHSITDHYFMKNILLEIKFDYIVLLAAVANVAESILNPYETHLINQEANINILEVIRKNKLRIKKLIFTSSAAVYGNTGIARKSENSIIDPVSPYAIDKYATERFVINYGKLYKIPVIVARFFNVYGPNQNPKSQYSGVISILVDCLRNNRKFNLYGNGQQTRDFIFVEDVIKAMCILLSSDKKAEVYNVATGESVPIISVIRLLEKATKKKLNIEIREERRGDINFSQADIGKIKRLGFSAKYTLEEGMTKYLNRREEL